jgi:dUTP pyrophosphatase
MTRPVNMSTGLDQIQIRQIDPALGLPVRAFGSDAGLDLKSRDRLELGPGQRALARTGIVVRIPRGYVGLVVPRSGLALKNGLTVLNAPGIIDAGYTGEIGVILINHDSLSVRVIRRGERIAQLLITKCEMPKLVRMNDLQPTARGSGGFGHSGTTSRKRRPSAEEA